MSTTISLTPATDRVRMCAKHSDRKATHLRHWRSDRPIPQVGWRPECPDCAARKLAGVETVAVRPIK